MFVKYIDTIISKRGRVLRGISEWDFLVPALDSAKIGDLKFRGIPWDSVLFHVVSRFCKLFR